MDLFSIFISVVLFHIGSTISNFNSVKNELHCQCNKTMNMTVPEDYTYKEGMGYYKQNSTGTTWNEARTFCANEGAHLAIVDSAEEQSYLIGISDEIEHWLGVHNLFKYNEWVTVLDKNMTYLGWIDNNPDNLETERCLSLRKNGMNNLPCNFIGRPIGFFCEINC